MIKDINIEELMLLNRDDLDDVLLRDDLNNKAHLRELIRRSLSLALGYKNQVTRANERISKKDELLEEFSESIKEISKKISRELD